MTEIMVRNMNGADLDEMKERINEIHTIVVEQSETLSSLVALVGTKVDSLINVIAGKGMIPLDVFKWLVIFLLVFVLAMQFGITGFGELIKSLKQ